MKVSILGCESCSSRAARFSGDGAGITTLAVVFQTALRVRSLPLRRSRRGPPGLPRTINDDEVAAVIERTLRTMPVDATHWSIRSMAEETGFSHTTICRMWAAFVLQPHRSQTFRYAISSPFTCLRRTEPCPLAWMRKAKSRHLIASNRSYRCLAYRNVVRTGMCGMARPRCLPDSMSPRGLSSANATRVTGRRVLEVPQRGRCPSPRRARCPYRHG